MIGKKLGNYIPFELLGRGGMGEVYKARHATFENEIVAVKTILYNQSQSDDTVARFKREAKIARPLKSEKIASVIDFGEAPDEGGKLYLVMEYVEGETLLALLARERTLPFVRAVNIAVQIGEALEVAHAKAIVHRDLKPGNVMILPGEKVKVLDFGIAKAAGILPDENNLTRTGMIMGTPNYISPEQAFDSKDVDARSDIFALGVMLYEMLIGRLPFDVDGKGVPAILLERQNVAARPIPQKLPDGQVLPDIFREAVMCSLEQNRENRFTTVSAFIKVLRTFLPESASAEARNSSKPGRASNSTEQQAWERIAKSDKVSDFEAFLKFFPKGDFAAAAQFQIHLLKKQTRTLPVKKKTQLMLIGGILVGVLALGLIGGVAWRLYSSGKIPGQIIGAPIDAPPIETTSDVTNQFGIRFVRIPAGSFTMGSEAADEERWNRSLTKDEQQTISFRNERPSRMVRFEKQFYMGRFEVTLGQWYRVATKLPKVNIELSNVPHYDSPYSAERYSEEPVRKVSWDDCQEFIGRLNALGDGYRYRLPTEAEWEYACRSGTTGDYAGELKEIAWISGGGNDAHSVGTKQSNAFGLYDMHGNVWEWCEDRYHENYQGAPTDGTAWVEGAYFARILRGGAYNESPVSCRSAYRHSQKPTDRFENVGFRLVMIPVKKN